MTSWCKRCSRKVLDSDGLCPSCGRSVISAEDYEKTQGDKRAAQIKKIEAWGNDPTFKTVAAEKQVQPEILPSDPVAGFSLKLIGGLAWLGGGAIWFGSVRGDFGFWGILWLFVGIGLASWGARTRRQGKRLVARGKIAGKEVVESGRPYCLYLRAFDSDGQIRSVETGLPFPIEELAGEEILAKRFSRIGEFLAFGRPGEQCPPSGARRIYARNDQWQDEIRTMIKNAAIVVMQAGPTKGLQWELHQAMQIANPQRFYIYRSFVGDSASSGYLTFKNAADKILPSPLPGPNDFLHFIRFDSQWRPSRVIDPKQAFSAIQPAWSDYRDQEINIILKQVGAL